ncbi:DUF1848 domain-containing protein [Methanoplanus sp. FWC-SCC4]|uniref:DUF1848 domain-containing protein n=2 Tax=Methanochimaera problematica TaxID=2609417 RepID=A0AA97I3G1_9EURY|nr:DUF1848 domain-containing protein [Methanoplanus sp. FWC-SCC4]
MFAKTQNEPLIKSGNTREEVATNTKHPVILSVSRTTDIPAFYSEWFIQRLKEGFCLRFNPYNKRPLLIDLSGVKVVVFWTKNPEPLMKHLDFLDEKGIKYYFQYTLNDYDKEGLEKNVPPLAERILTFKKLSEKLGPERAIWRFDPLLLSDEITVETLIERIRKIGDEISPYTEKLVFSFIDLYKSVNWNIQRSKTAGTLNIREFEKHEMEDLAEKLSSLCHSWKISAASCGEDIDLSSFWIFKNACVDPDLIGRISKSDPDIIRYLSKYAKKDKGQRESCRCIESTDIGQYNTCPHLCSYCYANRYPESVRKNYMMHKRNPCSPTILWDEPVMSGSCEENPACKLPESGRYQSVLHSHDR